MPFISKEIASFAAVFSLFAEAPLTEREQLLIEHVKESIERGEQEISKLNGEVLKLHDMSSPKVRHLLNNLCSFPDTHYLEIGCWRGSTWISALFGNETSVLSAVAIDNWSEFGNASHYFHTNCTKFLPSYSYQTYSTDCFSLDLAQVFDHPVNLYFYDGNHHVLSQELAFIYYDPVLEDPFIAIVDDWNWKSVQNGTHHAFQKLHYEILFEKELPASEQGSDAAQWWNGLYVAVIRKSRG